jgi:hypothetical protein
MTWWLLNHRTGMVVDVPDDHWAIGHPDFEVVGQPAAPHVASTVTDLPPDFPAREVLTSYGFTTIESLVGMTAGKLQGLKGIGPARARAIVEAVHAET